MHHVQDILSFQEVQFFALLIKQNYAEQQTFWKIQCLKKSYTDTSNRKTKMYCNK